MRTWLLAAAFWIFVAALYAAQIAWMAAQPGERIMFRNALIWNTSYYLCWVPFTPLAWRIAGRWTPGAMTPGALLLRHGALATVLVVMHGLLNVLVVGGLFFPQYLTGEMIAGQLRGRFVSGLLIYVAIAGAGMAFAFYARWKERELAAATLQAQLSDARLQSLKAQLHPHFLFNSLHAIASLVRTGDNPAAVRTIAALSDLLRRVLDADARPEIPLEEEAAFIERYFDIQRVRFGDRLSASVALAPGTERLLVPALVLQPLVENAFRHGLADRVEPGSISVQSAIDGDGRLELTVDDDGQGLPSGWTLGSTRGVGLRTTAARLEQRYGAGHRFSVTARSGGGTRAVVAIPREVSPEGP